MRNKKALVIGAGIVGLATSRALAKRGFSVEVFDRHEKATGASVRNFGMIWPIGQPGGTLYQRASNSRSIWKEICTAAGIWHEEAGSLHLAYHPDEMQVLSEICEAYQLQGRKSTLLNTNTITEKYDAVNPAKLLGGLHSAEEMIVDPRESLAKLPVYLSETEDIYFNWNTCITHIKEGAAFADQKKYDADIIFICSGADFETLFPGEFAALPLTKCKLQMMRLVAQPGNWRMGPALCGGLSLIHYPGFKAAPSLTQLNQRYQGEMKAYIDWGIHVMVAQNGMGELTIGDSHEYGSTHDPFDKQFINQLILDYLFQFARFKDPALLETWHGIYSKCTNGATEIFLSPQENVYILNGLGGNGMTMSFGLAEEIIDTL